MLLLVTLSTTKTTSSSSSISHGVVVVAAFQQQQQAFSSHVVSNRRRHHGHDTTNLSSLFAGVTNKSHIERNKKILGLGKHQRWQEILDLYEEESDSFNEVNLATTMSQLGRIRGVNQNDPRFRNFVDDLVDAIVNNRGMSGQYNPRVIANTAHAMAKMGIKHSSSSKRLFEFLSTDEDAISSLVTNGSPQNVANTAWACAKLDHPAPKFFDKIEEVSDLLFLDGNTQQVANTAWACAKLGHPTPNLFEGIERASDWLVKEGTPQEVANTAWACATLEYPSPRLFHEIEEASQWLAQEGTTQAVANTAWAFATLGYEAPRLFSEIEQRSEWLVDGGTEQEISNAAWAFAMLGYEAPRLLKEIERRSDWLVSNSTPQGVSITAFAFARLGYMSPDLFDKIEQRADWLVRNGTPHAISTTVGACLTLGLKPPKLLREIERRADWFVQEGDLQAISTTAFYFAKAGYPSSSLFSTISKNMESIVEGLDSIDLISYLCYSFAVLDVMKPHEEAFLTLWNAAKRYATSDVDAAVLNQLLQTYIFARVQGIELTPLPFSDVATDHLNSEAQMDVSQILSDLGLPHEQEVLPWKHTDLDLPFQTEMLAIDLAVEKLMIAIEFDGPTHFVKVLGEGLVEVENGPTQAKRRFLERLGWKVVNIPYFEYAKYRKTGQNMAAFIKRQLYEQLKSKYNAS